MMKEKKKTLKCQSSERKGKNDRTKILAKSLPNEENVRIRNVHCLFDSLLFLHLSSFSHRIRTESELLVIEEEKKSST